MLAVFRGQNVGGAAIELAGTAALERHDATDRFDHNAGCEIVYRALVGRQVVERQIDTPAREVGFDVAKDIRELKSDTQIERVIARAIASAAEDLDADQPHRRSDAPTILEQLRKRLISSRIEVHRDPVDDILEGRPRQVQSSDERLKTLSLRGFRLRAGEATRKLGAPELDGRAPVNLARGKPFELTRGRGGRRCLVYRIVNRATKIPDRDDRAALFGRQDQKRIVEAGLSGHYDRAPLHRAARQTSSGASAKPSVGRRSSAMNRSSSTRSRIRMPPSQVKRSSARRRPRTPSHTARPAAKRSRVKAAEHSSARAQGSVIRPTASSDSSAPQASCTSRGTYNRPARQSRPKSCQKFVNCKAVQSASDDRSSASSRYPAMRSTRRPTGFAERRQ